MLRGLCCGGVPVEFLTDEEAARYGRYSGPLSRPVLEKLFYLDDEDKQLIERRHRPHLMLGFAVQLVTVRYLGTFLNDPLDVPTEVIDYVAGQLGIEDPSRVKRYTERRPTRFEHQEEIRRAYGAAGLRSSGGRAGRLGRRPRLDHRGRPRRRSSPTQ